MRLAGKDVFAEMAVIFGKDVFAETTAIFDRDAFAETTAIFGKPLTDVIDAPALPAAGYAVKSDETAAHIRR